MPLSVEVLESPQALTEVAPEWRDLWRRDPAATPFHSPDWLLPWTRHLWGGGRPRALALFADGRRAAFAGAAGRAVFDWLAANQRDWHACDLQELRANSPLLRVDPPAGLNAVREECSVCPVASAPGAMDEFEAALPAAFRHNLHTAENRLRKHGDFKFLKDNADELIPALFRLHETRWRGREQEGMVATDALQVFHCEAIGALMRSGTARLYGLRIRGEIAAVQYNLLARGVCYLYLSGFDPRYSRFSPGMLLLRESIRCAIWEGAREPDFLRHREPFKYRWGASDRANYTLRLRPASA